jgi:hypothetical protein
LAEQKRVESEQKLGLYSQEIEKLNGALRSDLSF